MWFSGLSDTRDIATFLLKICWLWLLTWLYSVLVFLLLSCCCHCPVSWKRWLRGDYGISIIIIQIYTSLLIWKHCLENQGKCYRGILHGNFKASSMGTSFRILLQPVVLFLNAAVLRPGREKSLLLLPYPSSTNYPLVCNSRLYSICDLQFVRKGLFCFVLFLFLFYFKGRTAVKIVVKFSFFKYLRGSWQKWTALPPCFSNSSSSCQYTSNQFFL